MANLKQAIILGDGELARRAISSSTSNKMAGLVMVKIHNKLCKLNFREMKSERREQIEAGISVLASKLGITRHDPIIVNLENKIKERH